MIYYNILAPGTRTSVGCRRAPSGPGPRRKANGCHYYYYYFYHYYYCCYYYYYYYYYSSEGSRCFPEARPIIIIMRVLGGEQSEGLPSILGIPHPPQRRSALSQVPRILYLSVKNGRVGGSRSNS